MKFGKKDYEEQEKEMEAFVEEDKTDEDILKNPQEELKEGIETEEFDVKPNFDSSQEFLESLKDKEGIVIPYSFNGDEVKRALKLFQKETIYKKNIIYSVLSLALFALFVYQTISNPDNGFSAFFAAACVALFAFIWYMPYSHLKKTAKATDLNPLSFTMTVYDDCIKIGEENGSFVMKYNKEVSKIYEMVDMFLICAGKERIFILPKRCLKDGQTTELKELFSLVMQEKYIKKL